MTMKGEHFREIKKSQYVFGFHMPSISVSFAAKTVLLPVTL